MLWAALLLPRLPLEVYTRGFDDEAGACPFAVASGGSRPAIVDANDAARLAGVKRGMAVAGALALVPALVLRDRDAGAEVRALTNMATWALGFTSTVSIAAPAAVVAEVGGSERLHGGLDPLVARIATGLAARGHAARIGVAPTPLAALALARMQRGGRGERVATIDALAAALALLPLAALGESGVRLDFPEPGSARHRYPSGKVESDPAFPRALETLAAAGVRTIGEAEALPRDGLARRFGQALVDTLDRAHARKPDPREPWIPPADFIERLDLPAPAQDAQALGFAAARLTDLLAAWLRARGLGVLRCELVLEHERGARTGVARRVTTVPVGLAAPARASAHLLPLLRERLARTTLPAPVERIALATIATAPLAGRTPGLFPGDEAEHPLVPLVDRLRARLGDAAVVRSGVRADHRPERALAHPRDDAARDPVPLPPAPRPLWLVDPPRPLGRELAAAPWTLRDGPERIESGWWDGGDLRRDYYVALAPGGAQAWIFRDHRRGTDDGEWWLQGWFA